MNKTQKYTIILIFVMGFMFFAYRIPDVSNVHDHNNYFILLVAYVICSILSFVTITRRGYYVFEPYTMIMILYMIIMVIRPMQDIINREYFCHGTDVMGGCFKGTVIFIFSYIALHFGYWYDYKIGNYPIIRTYRTIKPKSEYQIDYSDKVRRTCLILWGIGFVFALLYYVFTGRNPVYALSLGMMGDQTAEMGMYDSSVKFMMKLAFIMIIPWIYIIHFDKSKGLKLVTTVLMLVHFLAMGSRYILIVAVVGWMIFPYICEKKKFSFNKGLIVFAILLIAAGIIAFYRNDFRTGGSISLEGFTVDSVFSVFDSDFTIYRAYYCAVKEMPHNLEFQMGKGLIIYSLTSFLPSIIFPYKREFDNIGMIITTVVNERAGNSGIAYINLGQFYAEFGIIGCIICMFILGQIARRLKRLYESGYSNVNKIILYSTMFPFLMQLIIRGDLAQQLNSLLGIIIPYFVLKYTCHFHIDPVTD